MLLPIQIVVEDAVSTGIILCLKGCEEGVDAMFHGQIDEKPTVAKYESGKRHDSENDNQHTRANQHIAGAFLLLLIELRRVQQCHRACPPYKVSLSLDTGN